METFSGVEKSTETRNRHLIPTCKAWRSAGKGEHHSVFSEVEDQFQRVRGYEEACLMEGVVMAQAAVTVPLVAEVKK